MPSTVYKGDLAEVTFGHETGFTMTQDSTSKPASLSLSAATVAGQEYTTITFGGAVTGMFKSGSAGELLYPKNMLVGSRVMIIAGSGNWANDNYPDTGRLFTVIENAGTTMKITPAMASVAGGATVAASNGTSVVVDSFVTPSFDGGMNYDSNAATSDETVLTDQFVGIAATVALPETKVDIKRYHVVGVGRDVAVQAPGKFTNEGGSMELMLNSPRWLYYCLGGETVMPAAALSLNSGGAGISVDIAADIGAGDTHIDLDTAASSINVAASTPIAIGDYVIMEDTTHTASASGDYLIPIVQHKEVDLAAAVTASNYFGTGTAASQHTAFHEASVRTEVRRITGISASRLYVDDPWSFSHETGVSGAVKFVRFHSGDYYGSPTMAVTATGYGVLTQPTTRLLFPNWHLPSFALETSIRSRNVGTYSNEQDENAPDTASDSKQLTRVFKGCKVTDWSMSADTDGALKLSVNFGAAMCYTDTGRLEGTSGDRFTAHRMFENTANTPTARKEAGIAERTQKPYFFYNGSIDVGGQALAQVTNFTLSGSTGVTYHHTIRTSTIAETVTATGQSAMQIPFGGSRNASLAVEGKETFDLSIEVIVADPVFWHQMRGAQEFKGSGNEIRMDFEKQGATGTKERMTLVIDDYYIAEAPLPIPEDKGVIRSALKIVPKSVRIISTDTLLHC